MEAEEQEVQQQDDKPSKHGPRKCENPNCGKEFVPKNVRAKYCSSTCNVQASKIRLATSAGVMTSQPQPAFAGLGNLGALFAIPPHAQMMIDHHKEESKRWEKKYDAEVVDHKETKKKLEALKEEQNADRNPGGLSGFAERNPEIASKLIDFGSVLASKFGDKFLAPSTPAAVTEVAGLSGQAADMARGFAEFLPKISEQSQLALWQLISALSQEDEEKMNYIISSILQQWKR